MAEMKMTLTSPSFTQGGPIPARHTCDGRNVSPELRWMHAPAGTRSFALLVDDPDAPSGLFTHWVLFDIPSSVDRLAEGETGVGIAGRNDFDHAGYKGPCPPPNHGKHRYFFTLFALDVDSLELPQSVSRAEVEVALRTHVLGQAQLMGLYERRTG